MRPVTRGRRFGRLDRSCGRGDRGGMGSLSPDVLLRTGLPPARHVTRLRQGGRFPLSAGRTAYARIVEIHGIGATWAGPRQVAEGAPDDASGVSRIHVASRSDGSSDRWRSRALPLFRYRLICLLRRGERGHESPPTARLAAEASCPISRYPASRTPIRTFSMARRRDDRYGGLMRGPLPTSSARLAVVSIPSACLGSVRLRDRQEEALDSNTVRPIPLGSYVRTDWLGESHDPSSCTNRRRTASPEHCPRCTGVQR